ncbi:MAG: hypothetical protein ABSD89_06160 [Halobacteriota archaeon]
MTAELTREEFLRIARGDDPHRKAFWNGLPRITTPPRSPIRPMQDEGQLFEFLLPYPINIFDDAEWPALSIQRDEIHVHLLKPISLQVSPTEPVSAGNEAPDLFSTNFRTLVLRTAPRYPIKHADVFPIVREALQWIRVLSRQYWIGTGTAGIAAAYRGSAFRVEPPAVAQMNYAGYGQTVQVRALKLDSWHQVRSCVEAQIPVPPAESIFCDGLSSFVSGDPVRSVIELGISAEIELTNLLDDVAAIRPTAAATTDYLDLKRKHRDRFHTKLLQVSKAFGLDDPTSYGVPNMQSNWAELLQKLYGFRNKAAHEGRCLVKDKTSQTTRPLNTGELQSFVFAVEAMFNWARQQRRTLGLATVATPRRDDQIVSIIGAIGEGGINMDTSEACATI